MCHQVEAELQAKGRLEVGCHGGLSTCSAVGARGNWGARLTHQQKLIPWAVLAAPSPDGIQGEGQGLCASPGVCRARAVCAYASTCMYTHVSVDTHMPVCMQMYLCLGVCICICTCEQVHHKCSCVCPSVCPCVPTCAYMCARVCLCN